jgi:malate synthase
VTAEDLLRVPTGPITEEGLRMNVRVGVQYLAAWLSGLGCVPLYDLMEDAATAEISRAQVWQWIRHGTRLADGRTVDSKLLRTVQENELARIRATGGERDFAPGRLDLAGKLFIDLSTAREFAEFLTLPLYDYLLSQRT